MKRHFGNPGTGEADPIAPPHMTNGSIYLTFAVVIFVLGLLAYL